MLICFYFCISLYSVALFPNRFHPLCPRSCRVCEPKYAATVGVFYTGAPDDGDDGDPEHWSPTAHVMVVGGIIPTTGGQYTATDTVDILREEGVDPITGQVSVHRVYSSEGGCVPWGGAIATSLEVSVAEDSFTSWIATTL